MISRHLQVESKQVAAYLADESSSRQDSGTRRSSSGLAPKSLRAGALMPRVPATPHQQSERGRQSQQSSASLARTEHLLGKPLSLGLAPKPLSAIMGLLAEFLEVHHGVSSSPVRCDARAVLSTRVQSAHCSR
jgi:hypothetical protein